MAEEFEGDFFLHFDPSVFIHSSSDWRIGEIESELMNDNNHELELDEQSVSEFLADLIVDYPSGDKGKEAQGSKEISVEKKLDDSGSEIQDAVAKKRTRRLRNRDAAVRSRERKKEYVEHLERKSKYLERECMRLGRMLQCFAVENHSLRLCVQNGANNASTTKQESAVLFLESLLLGSLLWYLGLIICQFPLRHTTTQSLSLGSQEPGQLVQSGPGSSTPLQLITCKSRRCKASRPRMKQVLTFLLSSLVDAHVCV